MTDEQRKNLEASFEALAARVPAGYEPTGEIRSTKDGEEWLSSDGYVHRNKTCGYVFILRRILTIESVYGKPFADLEPPAGHTWLLDDDDKPVFRVPGVHDWFRPCLRDGLVNSVVAYTDYQRLKPKEPRLILRALKRIVFVENPNGNCVLGKDDYGGNAVMCSYSPGHDAGKTRYRMEESPE